jgi:glycosyltransferase involved in cell wall biosynthesis
MKIAFVTFGFGLGGTDRVCCHLAQGFHDSGDDVAILACAGGGKGEPVLHGIIAGGPPTTFLTHRRWGHRQVQKFMSLLPYIRWLRRERPDFVVATGNNICRFTALGFRLAGIGTTSRLVIKTTNPVIRPRKGLKERLRRRAFEHAFRDASAVLTLSDQESLLLARSFPAAANRFRAVYNPYLTAAFERASAENHAERKASGRNDGRIVMLTVGRLHHQKNYPRMLHAFAKIVRGGRTDLILRIAGDGPDRAEVAELINKLNIAHNVELLGYTSNVPELMAAADVLLLSSDYEGLPAVVIEALACNCPVISTDCFPMAKALLEPLPGCLVVEQSDPDCFAAALTQWLESPRERHPLRSHALRYSTASAIQSHRKAILESSSL